MPLGCPLYKIMPEINELVIYSWLKMEFLIGHYCKGCVRIFWSPWKRQHLLNFLQGMVANKKGKYWPFWLSPQKYFCPFCIALFQFFNILYLILLDKLFRNFTLNLCIMWYKRIKGNHYIQNSVFQIIKYSHIFVSVWLICFNLLGFSGKFGKSKVCLPCLWKFLDPSLLDPITYDGYRSSSENIVFMLLQMHLDTDITHCGCTLQSETTDYRWHRNNIIIPWLFLTNHRPEWQPEYWVIYLSLLGSMHNIVSVVSNLVSSVIITSFNG